LFTCSLPFFIFLSGHLTCALDLFTSISNQEVQLSATPHPTFTRSFFEHHSHLKTCFNCSDSPPPPRPLNPSYLCIPLLQLATAVSLEI
jgi:hypothetical protein